MKKMWGSKEGIIGATISLISGIVIFMFLHNSMHEKSNIQSQNDARIVASEIKENITHYNTLLHGVRAFMTQSNVGNKDLDQYISLLGFEKTSFNSIFYIAFNDLPTAKITSLNKEKTISPLLFKANLPLYELIDRNNKLDKVTAKVIDNKIIINLPILLKDSNGVHTIGIVGGILDKHLPFSISAMLQNGVIYQVISNSNNQILYESMPQTSYGKDYYDFPIHWDNINLLARVYVKNNYVLSTYNIFLISLGIAGIIYLATMLFISLLYSNEKAQLVASEMSKEMKHLGWHDSLTQLYNRYKINQELDLKITSVKDKNSRLFILCVDLEGFKRVNDELGHTAGDVLLQEYAQRLMKKVPTVFEVVARAGGDEFLIFIDANKLEAEGFDYQLDLIGKEFESIVNEPFVIKDEVFVIRQKIGVAMYPDHGQNAEELFKYAELAMYEAKVHQESLFVYQTELAKKLSVLNKMKGALALALENNEFYLVFQPKVTIDGNVIKKDAAEVLCRWKSPIFGNVAPDIFISLAEETGEIHKLGKWVMVEAIKQLAIWKSQGINLNLSINLSPKQLMNVNLPEEFNELLKQYAISTNIISLEMTENSMIVDKDQSQVILNKFHDLGFKISIDDFGKGHSSLSYLKDYPISEIKMDKSFIDDIIDNQFNQILVEGIILVSRKLKIDLVIEGVESQEQTEFLSKMGCSKYQGYYYSKPLMPTDLVSFLNK
jgi:diguanylate cyclase (GGDEF)-like protein